MWIILALAVGLSALGARASEAGTWAEIPAKISGNAFTAAFRDPGTGFGESRGDDGHGHRYGGTRLLASAEYTFTFYHYFPDNSMICFRYGEGIITLDSVLGPLKYQDVRYAKLTTQGGQSLYIDAFNAANATTCGHGASIVGGTKSVPLVTSLSNTFGWAVGRMGEGEIEANRAMDAGGKMETIPQKFVNLMLWNAGIGFSDCTVSMRVDGVLAIEFKGVAMGAGKELTLGCGELTTSPVTIAWTCDGESYTKDLNLDSVSCSGSSQQISLLGRKSNSSYPPVVVFHSGTDSCPETCGAVPESAAKNYKLALYNHVPKANHFICFKYGPSAFKLTTTVGPLRYKDVQHVSVSYSGTQFYFDVIEAQSDTVCGSSSVSLVSSFKKSSLVDTAQNLYGYSPQSSSSVGVDAPRAMKDGVIDVLKAGQVNILFYNSAKGFSGSCDVKASVDGKDGLAVGAIRLGSGKEVTQGCFELPDKKTTIVYTCDGEEFTWESGSGGLRAAFCGGSSRLFTLVGEKGSAMPPEVLLLSGAAAGCQTCEAQISSGTSESMSSGACNTCKISDVCACIKGSTISGHSISEQVDCSSGISFNPEDMVTALGVDDKNSFYCGVKRQIGEHCAVGCPSILTALNFETWDFPGCTTGDGTCPPTTSTNAPDLAAMSISLTPLPWLLFLCALPDLSRA